MIIVILAMSFSVSVVFSETGEALSVTSSSKYISRIEKKQALLLDMTSDSQIFKKGLELDSDLSYAARLDHKLEAVIKSAVRDIDSMRPWTIQPLMTGTCPPESSLNVEEIEYKVKNKKK